MVRNYGQEVMNENPTQLKLRFSTLVVGEDILHLTSVIL
jgi:hypothetical protein